MLDKTIWVYKVDNVSTHIYIRQNKIFAYKYVRNFWCVISNFLKAQISMDTEFTKTKDFEMKKSGVRQAPAPLQNRWNVQQ